NLLSASSVNTHAGGARKRRTRKRRNPLPAAGHGRERVMGGPTTGDERGPPIECEEGSVGGAQPQPVPASPRSRGLRWFLLGKRTRSGTTNIYRPKTPSGYQRTNTTSPGGDSDGSNDAQC